MLRLDLAPRQPRWVDLLPGVRLHLRPMTPAIWSAALHAAAAPGEEGGDGGEDPAEAAGFVARTVVAVAEMAILDWSGIGDEAGAPIPPSAAAIAALLARQDAWTAFNRLYLDAWYGVQDEKKGSAPLPNGISAGAPDIATPAPRSATPAPAASTPPAALKAG